MAYIYFAVVCVLFGSNFMLMDLAKAAFGPVTVGLLRLAGGAAVLLPVWWWGPGRVSVPWPRWPMLALVALLGNAMPFWVQPALLAAGVDHSFLAMFVTFTPLITLVVAPPLLGTRATLRQTIGVLGGLVMLAIVTLDGPRHGLSANMAVVALAVPCGYAVSNTLIRKYLHDLPAVPVSTLIIVLAALELLLPALWEIAATPSATRATVTSPQLTTALGSLLVLGPLGTGFATLLFVRLVQQQGPLFAGMVTYVVPILALFWGYVTSESITPLQMAGMVGALLMVALVQYNPGSKP